MLGVLTKFFLRVKSEHALLEATEVAVHLLLSICCGNFRTTKRQKYIIGQLH
jgi:hypothetical protein